MANFTGFYNLRTPEALLKKLEWEYHNLVNAKSSLDYQYHAFNFFVTAFHTVDWRFPGDENESARSKLKSKPLLKVCGHIANGAKHFSTRDEVKVVKSLKEEKYVEDGYVEFGYFENFYIKIDASEASSFSKSVFGISEFTSTVMDFWKNELVCSQ